MALSLCTHQPSVFFSLVFLNFILLYFHFLELISFGLDFHLFRKTKEISFPLAFKEVKNISDWNTGLGLANSEDEGKMEENSFSALLDNWRKIIRERGEIEAKWEEEKRIEERKKRSRERGAKIFKRNNRFCENRWRGSENVSKRREKLYAGTQESRFVPFAVH